MTDLRPHYSPTRSANGYVFVSGQLAFDANRRLVGSDVVAQTRQCLENVRSALGTEGLDLPDVVKITVWITRKEDFAAFNEAYAAFFPTNPPTRSTVVSNLVVEGALIEIEAIAAQHAG